MTDEHPFYRTAPAAGGSAGVPGWTPARSLAAGDEVLGDCGVLTVIANAGEAHRQGVKVYNLEVEQAHTYFVLAEHAPADADAVWVHNATYSNKAVEANIAAEIQLHPSLYKGNDKDHFDAANQGLAEMISRDPALEKAYRNKYGDDFVDDLYDGETPFGWTWHHALRSQSGGEDGWMHLMPRDFHRSNHGMLHPDGHGGYVEWARPAGAPPRTK